MVSFCTEDNGKCQLLAPEMHKVQMPTAQSRCSRAPLKCYVVFSPMIWGRADRHRTCCYLPRAQAAAEGFAAGIRFANVDIEKHRIARNIYGVSAVPTMRVFINGRMSEEVLARVYPAVLFALPR